MAAALRTHLDLSGVVKAIFLGSRRCGRRGEQDQARCNGEAGKKF
jgi:hypothetical protein